MIIMITHCQVYAMVTVNTVMHWPKSCTPSGMSPGYEM